MDSSNPARKYGVSRGPDNPGFSPRSISELAASYGDKGPKTPISLRDNPDTPGRYIINHGHRRFRAAKVKKLTSIPAFIDNDYNEIDQIIENLQRNELTAREIADWIGRELAKGIKKAGIAKSIGKSAEFVSQHATLLNLPEPIAATIRARKLNDVTVINELAKAYKANLDAVSMWLGNEHQELTRGNVRLLRDYLEQRHMAAPSDSDSVWSDASDTEMPVDMPPLLAPCIRQNQAATRSFESQFCWLSTLAAPPASTSTTDLRPLVKVG